MTIEAAKIKLKDKGRWDPKALIMACRCERIDVKINLIKNDNDLYETSLTCDAETYFRQAYSLDVTMKWINDLFSIEKFVVENKSISPSLDF